jgi:hypothetical protein
MHLRIFQGNLLLKRALILAILASNMTFAISPVMANESGAATNVLAVALPGKSATISWTVAANAVDLGIVSYSVELEGYLTGPGDPAICTVAVTLNSAEHSCTVNDLPTNNQPYLRQSFYVVPTDELGRNVDLSQRSNFVTIYVTLQAPSAPREVTTIPGNGSIYVTWETPAFDGGSPITSYTVNAGGVDDPFCTTIDNSCILDFLTNGRNYFINVVATNAIGDSQPGYSQRWATPFVGNFDVFVPNSFSNYVDGHQQVRNLPSEKSLYSVGCESTADTLNLTLRTINTQNSNYSDLGSISFSDNPSIQNLSCSYVFTASGPNGVFMVIGNEEGDANELYGLNLSSRAATLIEQFDGIVLGLTQDNSGILRVLFRTLDYEQYPIPVLTTAVIDSRTATIEAPPVLVGRDKLVTVGDHQLLELGELDISALGGRYSEGAVKAVLFMGDTGPTSSDLNVVEFDVQGRIVEDFGAYLTPLSEILEGEESDALAFVFGFNSPSLLPNDLLSLLRNTISIESYFSFNPIENRLSFNVLDNRAYLLTGGSASDRAASLFELDLTSGDMESVRDFPAFSIPFGDDIGYGIDAPFAITTLDSDGVLWNKTNGLLQSELISSFQIVGDYQVARTAQSDFSVPSSTVSIFVAPSPIPPVVTPPVVTPPVVTPPVVTPPVVTPPVVVYVPPSPVPYLKALSAPKMNLKDGKAVCTSGTYNAGYTLAGIIQGSSTALFSPSSYVYNLLIDDIPQTSLVVKTADASASWNLTGATSGSIYTCSVTVTSNSITTIDKSTDNSIGVSTARLSQTRAIAEADVTYKATLKANSKAYPKALADNRKQWIKEIAAIRSNYYLTLDRIKAKGGSKMITDATTAYNVMVAAKAKSNSAYTASKPAAIVARDAANKAALDAKTAAIAKANAAYGAFIESIGYGVLIP